MWETAKVSCGPIYDAEDTTQTPSIPKNLSQSLTKACSCFKRSGRPFETVKCLRLTERRTENLKTRRRRRQVRMAKFSQTLTYSPPPFSQL